MNKFIKSLLSMVILSYFFTLVYMLTSGLAYAVTFKYHDVDPAFKPLTSQFYNTLANVCPNKVKYEVNYYTIEFSDSPDPNDWVGICKPSLNGYVIQIDKKTWDSFRLFPDMQQELMFHELSHCVIYREHTSNPGNYMYPSLRDNMSHGSLMKQVSDNMKEYCNDR